MFNSSSRQTVNANDEIFLFAQKGLEENIINGPYEYYGPGSYTVEFEFLNCDPQGMDEKIHISTVDVCANYGKKILSKKNIFVGDLNGRNSTAISINFEIENEEILEFRVFSTGNSDFYVRARRRIRIGKKILDVPKVKNKSSHIKKLKWPVNSVNFSNFSMLERAVIASDGRIPAFWATKHPSTSASNFGDALSPVVINALCGLPSAERAPNDPGVRLVTCGTVLNWQARGSIHVWGTGLDPNLNSQHKSIPYGFEKPDNLIMRVHAVRGALTRKILLKAGIDCPEVYGDPGYLLPKIIPESTDKTYELGIIPHISEFDSQTPEASILQHLKRYNIGDEKSIKIISTRHPPTWEGFVEKIREITSCKRIVSASYHGLIVPLAYGIPSSFLFKHSNSKYHNIDLTDDNTKLDHRVRDFFLGAGHNNTMVYGQPENINTNWDDVIKSLDSQWCPAPVDTSKFIESFPMFLLPERDRWKISKEQSRKIVF